jgi:hypothetical protein
VNVASLTNVSYKGDDKCGRRSFRVLKQGVQGIESICWSFPVFMNRYVLSDGFAVSVRAQTSEA